MNGKGDSMQLAEFLDASYTPYQAVEEVKTYLNQNGFTELSEREAWSLVRGGNYYVERNGSSLIAFRVGEGDYFKLIATHADSPCLKLKENPNMLSEKYVKWNVETYGGGIWYSFFDRPLKVAGRVVERDGDALSVRSVVSDYTVIIPSLAVHMNRGVNDGFSVNPQIDLLPLAGIGQAEVMSGISDRAVSYDLYVASAQKAFVSGVNGEFLCSPRIDNLTSVYASMLGLCQAEGDGICVAAIFDNEEVGSGTMQGAASDFLKTTLDRICLAFGIEEKIAFAKSMMISLDNAHAMHPNHPEKCDPTNRPVMGGGIVVKSHANRAYTTDALSSAIVKTVFDAANVRYQTFFNRSDMRSGGTLGAVSLGQVSVLTVDLGLAQLSMHSATECVALSDVDCLVKGLSAFYGASISFNGDKVCVK